MGKATAIADVGWGIEIVQAQSKPQLRGLAETPLQRLWSRLNLLETLLIRVTAAIVGVPVTVVDLPAPFGSRDTPVCYLVQRAGRIVLAEAYPGGIAGPGGLVERLRRATGQAGVMRPEKAVLEDGDDCVSADRLCGAGR